MNDFKTATGKTPGNKIFAKFRAQNGIGWGLEGPVSTEDITVEGIPTGSLTNIVMTETFSTVSIAWDALVVGADTGYNLITSYQLHTQNLGDLSTSTATLTGEGPHSLTLTKGVDYKFTITPYNFYGPGPQVVQLFTWRTVPGDPTGLSVDVTQPNFVFSWTNPTDTGGSPLTGVVIKMEDSVPQDVTIDLTNCDESPVVDQCTLNQENEIKTALGKVTGDTINIKLTLENAQGSSNEVSFVSPALIDP